MIRKCLYILIPILTAACISWGAYINVTVERAVPEEKFEQHVKDVNEKFDEVQQRIEDKLDKIQETILDLHKQ